MLTLESRLDTLLTDSHTLGITEAVTQAYVTHTAWGECVAVFICEHVFRFDSTIGKVQVSEIKNKNEKNPEQFNKQKQQK